MVPSPPFPSNLATANHFTTPVLKHGPTDLGFPPLSSSMLPGNLIGLFGIVNGPYS